MTNNTPQFFTIRAWQGFYFALILFAFFSHSSSMGQAQSLQNSDSNGSQQQRQVTAAMPEVKAPNAMLNTAASTGRVQTINLPGAIGVPLVHSAFVMQPVLPQPVYRGGEPGQAVNAPVMQTALDYRSGSDVDVRERSALDLDTAAAPTISSPSGEYTGSLRIMLASVSPASSIYYTLDGTEPTSASFLYEGPFTLTSNATLKAIAISNGKSSSRVTTVEYKIIPPTLGFEIGSNGIDSVEIFLTLNAPGAPSVAGEWTLTDGTLTLCSAQLTTETSMHCAAKLNRGSHDLKATYNGAYNGWKLTAGSTLRVD
jgi:hypothetical protein